MGFLMVHKKPPSTNVNNTNTTFLSQSSSFLTQGEFYESPREKKNLATETTEKPLFLSLCVLCGLCGSILNWLSI